MAPLGSWYTAHPKKNGRFGRKNEDPKACSGLRGFLNLIRLLPAKHTKNQKPSKKQKRPTLKGAYQKPHQQKPSAWTTTQTRSCRWTTGPDPGVAARPAASVPRPPKAVGFLQGLEGQWRWSKPLGLSYLGEFLVFSRLSLRFTNVIFVFPKLFQHLLSEIAKGLGSFLAMRFAPMDTFRVSYPL